jgi:hypothetical protein
VQTYLKAEVQNKEGKKMPQKIKTAEDIAASIASPFYQKPAAEAPKGEGKTRGELSSIKITKVAADTSKEAKKDAARAFAMLAGTYEGIAGAKLKGLEVFELIAMMKEKPEETITAVRHTTRGA